MAELPQTQSQLQRLLHQDPQTPHQTRQGGLLDPPPQGHRHVRERLPAEEEEEVQAGGGGEEYTGGRAGRAFQPEQGPVLQLWSSGEQSVTRAPASGPASLSSNAAPHPPLTLQPGPPTHLPTLLSSSLVPDVSQTVSLSYYTNSSNSDQSDFTSVFQSTRNHHGDRKAQEESLYNSKPDQ